MTDQDVREFAFALELTGEETVRELLEAGRYRAKKYEKKRPVIRQWLASEPWRGRAWLN